MHFPVLIVYFAAEKMDCEVGAIDGNKTNGAAIWFLRFKGNGDGIAIEFGS